MYILNTYIPAYLFNKERVHNQSTNVGRNIIVPLNVLFIIYNF